MKYLLSVIGGMIMGSALALLLASNAQVVGSVMPSGEYKATTTSATATGNYVILEDAGTLGSIIIASSSASTFTVLDADGTATRTVATLKAGATEGVFTFDTSLYNGLILQIPSGFVGQYITTYR